MEIVRSENGTFSIIHDGKEIDKEFATEDAAWAWADEWIDDQFTDTPNEFSPALVYRQTP